MDEKELNNLTKDIQEEIKNQENITPEQRLIIEAIKIVRNPFVMLTVKDVMRDLNICESVAYKTFKREDFPSINIGKNNQVMLLPYLL